MQYRTSVALLCSAALLSAPIYAQQAADQPQQYQLYVVRGENAQNNIKKGRATKAVVEVRDRNNKPVAGAAVLFLLPDSGPGGSFVGGAQSATVSTDSAGQAAITYQPNSVPGNFDIKVSVKDSNSTTKISQTNLAAVGAGLSTAALVWMIVGAGAGIGLGVGLATSGGGGSSSTNPVTLTPGGPVITPPK
jgi:hypothetical protein